MASSNSRSIGRRLILGTLAIALGPLALASVLIALLAWSDAREALTARSLEQLRSIQGVKRDELQAYFDTLSASVRALAASPSMAEHLLAMRTALRSEQTALTETQREQLQAYYDQDYAQRYAERNPGQSVRAGALLGLISAPSQALQHRYIASNPHPIGAKHQLAAAAGAQSYDQLHATLHPVMAQLIESFGFYDVFLIDADSGLVVYTYFKELDFATSLKDGPWAGSGLADAYLAALDGADARQTSFVDFRPYLPSYDDSAAFLAVPIVVAGRVEGVFAAQVPIDLIERIASFNQDWRAAGMGDSGELVMVGPDRLARAKPRGMHEDPQRFLAALPEAAADASTVDTMRARSTTVGLLEIESSAVQAALEGNSGTGRYTNAMGRDVLGAWSPVAIGGLSWALVAEIDRAEALAPATDLLRKMLLSAVAVGILLALLAAFVARRWARDIHRPIEQLAETVRRLSAGDMRARSHLHGSDELGQLGTAFDRLLDDRVAALALAAESNQELEESISAMERSIRQLADNDLTVQVPIGSERTRGVALAINELIGETASTLRNVLLLAAHASESAQAARQQAQDMLAQAQPHLDQARATISELQTWSKRLSSGEAVDADLCKTLDACADVLQSLVTRAEAVLGNQRDQARQVAIHAQSVVETARVFKLPPA